MKNNSTYRYHGMFLIAPLMSVAPLGAEHSNLMKSAAELFIQLFSGSNPCKANVECG